MITVLTGENSFELSQVLAQMMSDFEGRVERIDGSELELAQLPDLLMGATLFADKRLVVIKALSENKTVWSEFGNWLGRVSDDIHIVLVDAKLDKRTKTYKDLKSAATIQEFAPWGDRDQAKAESWATQQAARENITMDRKVIQTLVRRTGPDQWALYHALQKLSVLDEVTLDAIDDVVEASPSENVFNLFDGALRGDDETVARMVRTLEKTEDAYMVFGLLAGQAFQLAALAVADSQADVAKDIGAHPFALQKLAPHARRLGRAGAARIIEAFAQADDRLKSSSADPWLVTIQALAKISTSRS